MAVGPRPPAETFYVACQTGDVPDLIRHTGEDNLVATADYGHTDQSTQPDSPRR